MRKLIAALGFVAALIGGLVGIRRLFRSREDTDWEDAPRPGKLITVDGVGVHYVEEGKDGPPVVMIHGFGGNTFSFRHQLADLGTDHRAVAIDLPGFGYSQRADIDYSLDSQARLMLRAMDELGIERAVLIGHSMGGDVVARMAAMAPERVDRLVIVASAPNYPLRLGPRFAWMRSLMPFFARLTRWSARNRLFYDKHNVDIKAVRAAYDAPYRIHGSLDTVWRMWEDVKHDPPLDYSKLTMPTLVLWASKERILPAEGRLLRWLQERLPQADFVHIDQSGHMLLEEQPQASTAAIRRFISREVPDAPKPHPVEADTRGSRA